MAEIALLRGSPRLTRRVNSTTLPESVKSCIAEAVQKARVPAFRASTFNVNFPYRY